MGTGIIDDILRSTAEHKPAQWPSCKVDIVGHMRAYRAWQAALPASLSMGGSYVGRHVARKHIICSMYAPSSSGLQRGSSTASLEDAAGSGGRRGANKKASSDLTLEELQEVCPDQGDFLKHVPHTLRPTRRLAALLGVDALMISCWACLNREAVSRARVRWPGLDLLALAAARPALLRVTLDKYLIAHRVTPCPWILCNAFLKAVSREGNAGAAGSSRESDRLDESEGEWDGDGDAAGETAADLGAEARPRVVRKRPAAVPAASPRAVAEAQRPEADVAAPAPKRRRLKTANRGGARLRASAARGVPRKSPRTGTQRCAADISHHHNRRHHPYHRRHNRRHRHHHHPNPNLTLPPPKTKETTSVRPCGGWSPWCGGADQGRTRYVKWRRAAQSRHGP